MEEANPKDLAPESEWDVYRVFFRKSITLFSVICRDGPTYTDFVPPPVVDLVVSDVFDIPIYGSVLS
jgi:hypothetical protein